MRKLLLILSTFFLTANPTIWVANYYSSKQKQNLKNVLTVSNLGTVYPNLAGTQPTEKELKKWILEKNPNLDISGVKLTDITSTNAIVTGNGKIYIGSVTVTYTIAKNIELSDIISDGSDLDEIKTNGKDQPSIQDLKSKLELLHPNLNIKKIIIKDEDITDARAIINGDGDVYIGKVNVGFFSNKSIGLNEVIVDPILGTIKTNGEDLNEDIIKHFLLEKYPTLKINKIDISILSNEKAIISSNDPNIYTGEDITITFNVDKSVLFSSVLTNTELGIIRLKENQDVTKKDIEVALKANNLNPKLNIENVDIEIVSETKAIISSKDQKIYLGSPIEVSYQVKHVIGLKDRIKNTNLGVIKVVPEQELPTLIDITSRLKEYNLDFSKLNIEIKSDKLAIISSTDLNVYTGEVELTFSLDRSISLKSVLNKTDLEIVKVNYGELPSAEQLKASIKAKNDNINIEYINIDRITKESALVIGDKTHYQGQIQVTFVIDDTTLTLPFSHKKTTTYDWNNNNSGEYSSEEIVLLNNWKKYGDDWNDFSNKFSKLTFGDNSVVSVVANEYTNESHIKKGKDLNLLVKDITTDKNNKIFEITYDYDGNWIVGSSVHLKLNVYLFHDNDNIYLKYYWKFNTSKCFRDIVYTVNLDNLIFSK